MPGSKDVVSTSLRSNLERKASHEPCAFEVRQSQGYTKRPTSGRQERDRQNSGDQASTTQRGRESALVGYGPHRSTDRQGLRVSEKQCHSADGSGLMPIVQRSALQGTALPTYTRRAVTGSAELPEFVPEKPFKRRIGSNRSSPNNTCQPQQRVQHLSMENLESGSPKGLDRALTPSMLKAARKADSPLGGTLSSRTPGRAPHFHSSFSQQLGSRGAQPSYENLTASFTEGWSPKRLATPQSAISISSFKPTASLRYSSDSELHMMRGYSPSTQLCSTIASPFLPASKVRDEIQNDSDAHALSERNASPALMADDHVQQLLGKKSLNITTSKPQGEDESSYEDAFSTYLDGIGQKRLRKQIRCNITRISKRSLLGISKPNVFEMYNMKGRMKLCGTRDSGSQISFSIYTPGDGPHKKKLEASLVASTFVENQFLLIGTDPQSPAAACDPDQDPVIMAVAFGKSASGLRTVTALLPDNKATSAGSNDLGSKQHISSYFTRLAEGEAIKNVKVLRSTIGKELRGSRIARGSVKNVQLQVVDPGAEWPGATPKFVDEDSISAKYAGGKLGKDTLPPGRPIFEFGRLRHQHEFVCDYENPTLTAVQAIGLAIACSAPKRAFLYL